jgi:nucleoside-diphosphate-sugar epimerase
LTKLLIIGGTGFFGKSILDSFQRNLLSYYGIDRIVVGARNIESFQINFPELIDYRITLIKMDISSIQKLPDADIVIHAAASTDASDYRINPNGEKRNIEQSTTNYCQLAQRYHRASKIVYCSSGAVYGQQPEDLEKMDEDFQPQDVSNLIEYKRDYALGKRNAENEIIKLGSLGLNVSIARCFAFHGKYLPRDQHFAYGNFIGAAERGDAIEVKANHRVVRSYMHADGLVDSLMKIALQSSPQCPVFNVGSDEAIEIRDLANQIGQEYNVPVNITPVTSDKVDRYVPNTEKLMKLYSNLI